MNWIVSLILGIVLGACGGTLLMAIVSFARDPRCATCQDAELSSAWQQFRGMLWSRGWHVTDTGTLLTMLAQWLPWHDPTAKG